MDALRVSATEIDALRYFLEHEEAELGDLLARLRRETPPTAAMLAGAALHTALETCQTGSHDTLSADGYTFAFQADVEIDLPEIREIKATREYSIARTEVTLVGKVDAIHGRRVDDHKLTSRYDPERFLNSYQWRIYLEVFDADEFRWNVFEGRPSREDPDHYLITAVHPLRMHRYPGMSEHVERALEQFVEFARYYLPERFEERAA